MPLITRDDAHLEIYTRRLLATRVLGMNNKRQDVFLACRASSKPKRHTAARSTLALKHHAP